MYWFDKSNAGAIAVKQQDGSDIRSRYVSARKAFYADDVIDSLQGMIRAYKALAEMTGKTEFIASSPSLMYNSALYILSMVTGL